MKQKNTKHRPKPCLGFHFTCEEETSIKRAVRLSKEYMAAYGKGGHPCTVDLIHCSDSWHE